MSRKKGAPAEPLVALRNVSKSFGTVTALDGFDLDVRRSEVVSLLGPSGCGKTTVLSLIAGLTEPTHGTVEWHDPAARDDLGVVFQDATLMPWADVESNVWLPLRLRGRSKRAARDEITAVLDMVGLHGFEDAFPRELSGGMRMRVAIARALVTRPKLILMDEPFAALDEITRFRLNTDLLRLKTALDCTVVFVTHSVFESVFLSDRVLVMTPRPGRVASEVPIEADGSRDETFRTSAGYAALCRTVSTDLARAMEEGA